MGDEATSSESEPEQLPRSEHGSDEDTSSSASESGDEKVGKAHHCAYILAETEVFNPTRMLPAWCSTAP